MKKSSYNLRFCQKINKMTETTSHEVAKNWKKPFFLIWTGQAFSLLGSQLVQFALVWYLTKETGSATVLTTATLVALLPGVLVGPIAGSIVDRSNRKRIMILADSLVAASTLVLAGLFALGWIQLWHIYLLMLLRAIGGAFHNPAFTASTSLMVPKEQLSRIQGLNQTLNGGLNIFAAPLGALLLELLPMQGVLAVDVVTAAIAVTSLLFVHIPQPVRAAHEHSEKTSIWQDMRAGFRYVFTWPGMMITLIMATLLNLLLTPASALMPLFINKYFGGGAEEFASLEALTGVGVIAGGLLLGIWGGFKSRIVTAFVALIAMGASVMVFGLLPPEGFVLALAAGFAMGFTNPIVNGSLGATLQAVIDPSMQGRIFTLTASMSMAMTPIGLLVAGPLADAFGVQAWFVLGGGLCVLMSLIAFVTPSVMRLEQGRPEREPKIALGDAAEPQKLQ